MLKVYLGLPAAWFLIESDGHTDMNIGTTGPNRPANFHLLWLMIGRLALKGEISPEDARWACTQLIIAAAHRRHRGNKTHAAAELLTSRRVVRTWIRVWKRNDDGHSLLTALRLRAQVKREKRGTRLVSASDGSPAPEPTTWESRPDLE